MLSKSEKLVRAYRKGGWRRENVRDHKKPELGLGVRLCCGEDTNWQASNESTL